MFTKHLLDSMQTKNQQKLNAKQNSIKVALIPHVTINKYYYAKLTCAAENKR
jgi:hypothetical protein